MLSFLPSIVLFFINLVIIGLSTVLISLILTLVALIRLLCFGVGRSFFAIISSFFFRIWLDSISFSIAVTNKVDWHITKNFKGDKKKSYIVVSNHVSWLDTFMVIVLLHKEIPVPKFFMKNSLKYIPFAGQACWALDMPFLHRYSSKYLLTHPEARTKDIETTKKACAKFKGIPTTMVNFVEGTRATPEKIASSKSPYQNLLTPKTMSLSLAIENLGEQFDTIIDLTLFYPDNNTDAFKDMLFGRLKRVYAQANEVKITDDLRGNYLHDKAFKRNFTLWLKELWNKKDAIINNFKADL